MSFAVLGLGTALPPGQVTQQQALAVARVVSRASPSQAEFLPPLYRQTGIDGRRMIFDADVVHDVLHGTRSSGSIFLPSGRDDDRGPTTSQRMRYYVDNAQPLALHAAREALDQSGRVASELTHLVTVSCTGFSAPGLDFHLIQELGLAPTVERTHVGFMGCHGAVNGLRVAAALAGSQPTARVLVCAVELCSLHYAYGWEPRKLVANALFADGAAAVVGAPATDTDAWRVTATGSCLFPDSRSAMTWNVGDHGFDMTLSSRVPNLIEAHLKPWAEGWLRGQGLGLGDVGSWAVHPGGPRILTAVGTALSLDESALAVSHEVLSRHGNMSSPTVLFILDLLRQRRAPRPCVAMAFGPGLVAEAVLFQ